MRHQQHLLVDGVEGQAIIVEVAWPAIPYGLSGLQVS